MKYWLGMVLSKLCNVSKKESEQRQPRRKTIKFMAILAGALIITMFAGVFTTTLAMDWGTVPTESRVNLATGGYVDVDLTIPAWPTTQIARVIYPRRVIPFNPTARHTGSVPQYLFIEVAFPTYNYSLVRCRHDSPVANPSRDAVADFTASTETLGPAWSGTWTNSADAPVGQLFQAPAANANWVHLDTQRNVFLNPTTGAVVTEGTPGAQRFDIWTYGYTGGVNGVTQPNHLTATSLFTNLPVANFLEGMHRLPQYQLDMGTEFPIRVRAFATQADYLPNALSGINITSRPVSNFHTVSNDMSAWTTQQRLANAYRVYLGRAGAGDVLPALVAGNVPGF